jgi:tetratricopeptide (TPR) repeat protein
MEGIKEKADFSGSIARIVNFLRHTHESGFLFCACNNQRLIQEINRQIIEKAKHHDLNIRDVYISYDDMDNILSLLRKASQKSPNGIIINNLDELIARTDGRFITDINMGREILIDMGVPMVFWLSEENISRFANQATDLFNRRDRSVVSFPNLSGVPASMERLDGFYELGFKSTEDYNSLKLKIGLMEKQLQEAKKKNYSEERIATEIAADLIELYVGASLYPEAYQLFEDYHSHYETVENIKFFNLCRRIYHRKNEWDKALVYYLKWEQISLEAGDMDSLSKIYNSIGFIYCNKNDLDKALMYHKKSEQIRIECSDHKGLGSTYFGIGLVYYNKNEYDNTLKYFMKTEQIAIEVGDRIGVGVIYNNIGRVYDKKGEWEKALEYHKKSELIRIEIGDRAGLGWTYNNIGEIYSYKGEWDKALTYFLKAEQIWIEVGNRRGLAYTYFNIGKFYLEKQDKQKSDSYFILAGYIAKTLGMKPELSEWSWALNPLIEEMGEERFMEEGKRLLEERGIV